MKDGEEEVRRLESQVDNIDTFLQSFDFDFNNLVEKKDGVYRFTDDQQDEDGSTDLSDW
jgi:hypothetical protein